MKKKAVDRSGRGVVGGLVFTDKFFGEGGGHLEGAEHGLLMVCEDIRGVLCGRAYGGMLADRHLERVHGLALGLSKCLFIALIGVVSLIKCLDELTSKRREYNETVERRQTRTLSEVCSSDATLVAMRQPLESLRFGRRRWCSRSF